MNSYKHDFNPIELLLTNSSPLQLGTSMCTIDPVKLLKLDFGIFSSLRYLATSDSEICKVLQLEDAEFKELCLLVDKD